MDSSRGRQVWNYSRGVFIRWRHSVPKCHDCPLHAQATTNITQGFRAMVCLRLQANLYVHSRYDSHPRKTKDALAEAFHLASHGKIRRFSRFSPSTDKRRAERKPWAVSSDLNCNDKMNFAAAAKVCSRRVIEELKKIPATEATIVYLEIMNSIIQAYLPVEDCALCGNLVSSSVRGNPGYSHRNTRFRTASSPPIPTHASR